MSDDSDKAYIEILTTQVTSALVQMIPDAMPLLISYIDKDRRYRFNNKEYEKWWGHKREDIYGKHLQEVLGDKGYENLKPAVDTVLSGKPVHWENSFVYKDGRERYIAADYVPHFGSDDEVLGFFAVVNDITERKRTEEALEQKVSERTEELKKNNLKLEKMNQELASFAYISSHDLQEPLRKIQMFSKRIMEKELQVLSEEGRNFFMRMDNAANRMQQLINDLLEYSRTTTDPKHFEVTDLNHLLNEVKQDMGEKLQLSGAMIQGDKLPSLKIIPFQFRQLFANILGNSIKFAKRDTPVVIKLTYSKIKAGSLSPLNGAGGHMLSISDNGIGFDPQFNEQIFGVFQRLHGKSEFEGTGIGLSIVKRIVENHQGTISAEGSEGNGATFTICLPD